MDQTRDRKVRRVQLDCTRRTEGTFCHTKLRLCFPPGCDKVLVLSAVDHAKFKRGTVIKEVTLVPPIKADQHTETVKGCTIHSFNIPRAAVVDFYVLGAAFVAAELIVNGTPLVVSQQREEGSGRVLFHKAITGPVALDVARQSWLQIYTNGAHGDKNDPGAPEVFIDTLQRPVPKCDSQTVVANNMLNMYMTRDGAFIQRFSGFRLPRSTTFISPEEWKDAIPPEVPADEMLRVLSDGLVCIPLAGNPDFPGLLFCNPPHNRAGRERVDEAFGLGDLIPRIRSVDLGYFGRGGRAE